VRNSSSETENDITGTTDVADHPEFADRKTTKVIDGESHTGWFTEDFTFAEITTLRVRERLPFRGHEHDGQFKIPSFEEVIDLARRKSLELGRTIGVYPETKHPTYFRSIGLSLEEPLLKELQEAGYHGKTAPVYIQSFEVGNLKRFREVTDLPLIQLMEAEGKPWDDPRTYHDLATPAGLAEIARYADGIGPDKRMIVPAGSDGRLLAPTSLVKDAHAAKLRVHPWTFRGDGKFLASEYGGDPLKEYDQLFSLGVDGLFSDFPDTAVKAREAWRQH